MISVRSQCFDQPPYTSCNFCLNIFLLLIFSLNVYFFEIHIISKLTQTVYTYFFLFSFFFSVFYLTGTFRLRFRNFETNDIAWNSDIYAVESAIENLQSTGGATFQGDVTVEVIRGHPECNATVCCAYNRTNGTSFHGNMM